jgi:hypothetical protein
METAGRDLLQLRALFREVLVKSFEEAYHDAVDGTAASPELVARLKALYEAVPAGRPGAREIRGRLVELLEYLCSDAGRTDANCKAVDYFFCLADWSFGSLSSPYQDLFADMGGALHDAVADPDIAEALQATPEDLLAKARALP